MEIGEATLGGPASDDMCNTVFVNEKWAESATSVGGTGTNDGSYGVLYSNGLSIAQSVSGKGLFYVSSSSVGSAGSNLWYINTSGGMQYTNGFGQWLGVRPIVKLKPGVMTSGDKIEFLGNSSFELL